MGFDLGFSFLFCKMMCDLGKLKASGELEGHFAYRLALWKRVQE